MGRWVHFDDGDQYKFWFGTQSSEDITSFGGATEKIEYYDEELDEDIVNEDMIAVHWNRKRHQPKIKAEIKALEKMLKANNLTYNECMKRQDPEWCRSNPNRDLPEIDWKVVARLNLGYIILDHLEKREDVYCEAEYY